MSPVQHTEVPRKEKSLPPQPANPMKQGYLEAKQRNVRHAGVGSDWGQSSEAEAANPHSMATGRALLGRTASHSAPCQLLPALGHTW